MNITLQQILAPCITKAASKQAYYTIRFLVDHERVTDAYRAYAYFRWVDDILDGGPNLPLPKSARTVVSGAEGNFKTPRQVNFTSRIK